MSVLSQYPESGHSHQPGGSVGLYSGYVDLLHCKEFPEDIAVPEYIPVPTEFTETRAKIRLEDERIILIRQLSGTVGLAHLELGISKPGKKIDTPRAAHQTQAYLLDVVGPLAMERIPEDWFIKNPRLNNLRNPFENFELTRFIQRFHRDHRLKAGIGKTATMSRLAPGYFN